MNDGVIKPNAQAETPDILFVCTQNATRSPMAAALAALALPNLWVASAGIYGGADVDQEAVAIMAEIGVDIGQHRGHSISDLAAEGLDIADCGTVVALTATAASCLRQCRAAAVVDWRIPDPTIVDGSLEQRTEAYRVAREALRSQIKQCFLAK